MYVPEMLFSLKRINRSHFPNPLCTEHVVYLFQMSLVMSAPKSGTIWDVASDAIYHRRSSFSMAPPHYIPLLDPLCQAKCKETVLVRVCLDWYETADIALAQRFGFFYFNQYWLSQKSTVQCCLSLRPLDESITAYRDNRVHPTNH